MLVRGCFFVDEMRMEFERSMVRDLGDFIYYLVDVNDSEESALCTYTRCL